MSTNTTAATVDVTTSAANKTWIFKEKLQSWAENTR